MPTSYTSLIGLALPVTGELSGTWGDTVNDYITKYVDAAVAGAQTISGSQTAVTLSVTNGSTLSQAGSGATGSSQYAIINCTGNPAGLLTITAPASSKAYLVINATSTSQSVKVVGSGPTTGVTIAASRAALIAWNGSDFRLIASTDVATLQGLGTNVATALGTNVGSAGAFVVNGGALGTPSSGTLSSCTSLPISTGVSGLGTGVATALAVNTGSSGAFVVNGGALGTPSSGTVTNLTGTASININGTVGATTPNTGSFTTLAASSTVSGTGFSTYLASPPAIGGTTPSTGNFTAITSTSEVVTGAAGVLTRAAAAQDGVELIGRAGGTSSYKVSLTPTTLSASRTLTLPDNSGTVLTTGATVTVAQGGTGLTSGTSGGIPYFSSTSAMTSSGVLAANALVLGGGAGASPATTTTGTGVVTALGVNVGTAGAFVVNGGALGTPSSGTVTNLTGTASININGTVGATTPSTGVFTQADVDNIRLDANTISSTNTNGNITIAPNGTGSVVVQQTDAGATAGPILNLYRNSASPAASDVIGQVLFQGKDSAGNDQTYAYIQSGIEDATSTSEDGNIQFFTTAAGTTAERMRVDSAGRVGIAFVPLSSTGANGDLLQIGSPTVTSGSGLTIGSTTTGDIQFADAISGTGQYAGLIRYSHSDNSLALWTASSERARITSGGDVGIGTSSPGAKLDVTGAASSIGLKVRSGGNTGINILDIADAGGAGSMILTATGELLVGTTNSSATAGQGFKVSGGDRPICVRTETTNAQSVWDVYSTGASAYRFYVGLAGTVYATNTTISAISDQRLKENIVDLDVGLNAIMALKPRKFDWKANKGKNKKSDRGFIAQEFEQVFPDLIDEWKDPAPEGEEPYKSVRQDLIPVLVKAIQEQQAIIESLTARIAALESKGA